jgi:hypothetical protein
MALVYVATGSVELGAIGARSGWSPPSRSSRSSGWRWSPSASASRSRSRRSTCGSPTSTRVPRPASPRSWRQRPRPQRSPCAAPVPGRVPDRSRPVGAGAGDARRGTMLYGAYLALVQHDVKRMLAYSSITHAGYATIGVVANSDAGLSATLWYLLTYAVGTVGAFGCVIAVERRRRGEVTLLDLRGLGRSSPALAGILGCACCRSPASPRPPGSSASCWSSRRASPPADLAGGHRGRLERRRGVLLPAHRRHDVPREPDHARGLPVVTMGCRPGSPSAGAGRLPRRPAADACSNSLTPPRSLVR